MPGAFSIPAAGIHEASLDEILERSHAAGREEGHNEASQHTLKAFANLADSYLLEIKGADGQPILKTDLQKDAALKVASLLEQIPEGRYRRRLLRKVTKALRAKRKESRAALDKVVDLNGEYDRLRMVEAIFEEFSIWFGDLLNAKLGRATGSMMHKFRDALSSGRIADLTNKEARLDQTEAAAWEDAAASASVFVVEHDWGAAFAGAQDFDAGDDIKLPADVCAFEFHIGSRRVIALAIDADGVILLQHAVFTEAGWSLTAVCRGHETLDDITRPQIRAIAVALEAEIAVGDVVRAPIQLNRSRERSGKTPLSDYHVVSLARRTRAPALESGETTGARKRLHFRRGHWRHYETHKTWIKWMLVGDPDLGFVDKHYRL